MKPVEPAIVAAMAQDIKSFFKLIIPPCSNLLGLYKYRGRLEKSDTIDIALPVPGFCLAVIVASDGFD